MSKHMSTASARIRPARMRRKVLRDKGNQRKWLLRGPLLGLCAHGNGRRRWGRSRHPQVKPEVTGGCDKHKHNFEERDVALSLCWTKHSDVATSGAFCFLRWTWAVLSGANIQTRLNDDTDNFLQAHAVRINATAMSRYSSAHIHLLGTCANKNVPFDCLLGLNHKALHARKRNLLAGWDYSKTVTLLDNAVFPADEEY